MSGGATCGAEVLPRNGMFFVTFVFQMGGKWLVGRLTIDLPMKTCFICDIFSDRAPAAGEDQMKKHKNFIRLLGKPSCADLIESVTGPAANALHSPHTAV